MRFLVAHPGPGFSVHDVHVGWVEALSELGEQVKAFNLDDRLQLAFFSRALIEYGKPDAQGRIRMRRAFDPDAAVGLAVDGLASDLWSWRPDVLLVVSGFFVPHWMLDHARSLGTRVVALMTEQPYELKRELELAEHADIVLLNDPLHLDRFKAMMPREAAFYAPHAYRPSVHHPGAGTDALRSDLAFVGTGFGSRRWFFERMAEAGGLDGHSVLLAGNWQGLGADSPLRPFMTATGLDECLDNAETAEVYRSARLGLNLYRREHVEDGHQTGTSADGLAMGPREVEMAATGLPFLRDPRPEGDQVLHMLPTFRSPDEAAELLAWWLDPAHEDAREKAGRLAREAVEERTFTAHARQLLRLLGN